MKTDDLLAAIIGESGESPRGCEESTRPKQDAHCQEEKSKDKELASRDEEMAMKRRNQVARGIKEVWEELSDATLAGKHEEMLETNSSGHARRKEELSIDP